MARNGTKNKLYDGKYERPCKKQKVGKEEPNAEMSTLSGRCKVWCYARCDDWKAMRDPRNAMMDMWVCGRDMDAMDMRFVNRTRQGKEQGTP